MLLLATVVLWALNFTVSKYILEHGFKPLAYGSVRYASAGLLFVLVTVLWEHSLALGRRDAVVALGSVAILVTNQVTFVYALRFTTAATVALLMGTLPIFVAILSRALGLEQRLGRRFWVASLVSFAGVALVAAGSGGGLSANLRGDALAVAASLTWGAYSVAITVLMRRHSPFRVSAIILPATALILGVIGAGQLGSQDWSLSPLVWAAFAFAVVGPLFLTNVTWFTALERVGPARATLFTNLQPFIAALAALVILSEPIDRAQIAGGVAIAAGIVLARRPSPRAAAE
jgi:drug/metabolite transporter (DMT)-like permease